MKIRKVERNQEMNRPQNKLIDFIGEDMIVYSVDGDILRNRNGQRRRIKVTV